MIPTTVSALHGAAPSWYRLRSALVFCAPMIVNGIAMPYYPVWLKSLQMTGEQIGFILAVPMILRIIAGPLVSMIADRIDDRSHVLIWSGLLSLATAISLFWIQAFWPVVIIMGIQGAVYAPFVPVAESILMTGVRRWGFDYGQMRLWGSLAFIVATVVGGRYIGIYGGDLVLPVVVFGFILTCLAGLIAPRAGKPQKRDIDAADGQGAKSALKNPDLLLLLAGAAISGSSHAMLFAFSAIYWHDIGFSGTAIGILWGAGVMAEVVMFILSRWLLRNFSLWNLIFFGLFMTILRWVIFPEVHSFVGFFALQCFHAFSFASIHIGVQNTIVRRVSEGQETSAQGLYFFFSGLSLAISTLISGYLYSWFGLHAYYAMSVVSVIGLLCALAAWYLQPHRLGSGGKTVEPA
jgi:MFS transporter, PPP family, 3-phenylpropionic acid transporter